MSPKNKQLLPIKRALDAKKLSASCIPGAFRLALRDYHACEELKDEYVKCIEEISLEEFKDPKDKEFRIKTLRQLKNYDFRNPGARQDFVQWAYNVDLASQGLRVIR